ncbi:MAG: hypothetical protein KA223_09445, partial [Candidatus Accumulibacter sp.]|nr:hypothetical protein [Accumulibacter sp.]
RGFRHHVELTLFLNIILPTSDEFAAAGFARLVIAFGASTTWSSSPMVRWRGLQVTITSG